MATTRQARVRAFAKINLSLQVLHKRPDGYHELRTIFQTISLADRISISFTPARRTTIHVASSVEIADNLMVRAAELVLQAARAKGSVQMTLAKRIPMGGGLGGGSSDAASVLLALPALTGKRVPEETLHDLASRLGSDVPFFLIGGTAAAMGRGEQLYPMASLRGHALIVIPPVHVSTAEAYRDLDRPPAAELTADFSFNRMKRFQSLARLAASSVSGQDWPAFCENDFEAVVFQRFPLFADLHRKLLRLGAAPARMSGSGAALFGVFPSLAARDQARLALGRAFPEARVEAVRLLSRESYQAAWTRWLGYLE